ncbi:MAG TPA: hypothetical protein VK169_21540 [Saprospiraceae bacterium]|nr:hypothetical protein [Saprospiraceae bacterium]
MNKYKFIYLLIIIHLASCKEQVDYDKLITEFAYIQCRAIVLKDKRFQMADHLRSIEIDSIDKKKEIDSLKIAISEIKNTSLVLADSIKVKLDDILTNKLSGHDEQKEFTDRLAAYIKANGCSSLQAE